MILVVHPSFPAKTVQEFIAYAKANPGKLNFANAGAGNVTHLTGAMFRTAARIEFVDVPHKGGAELVTAVLGQQVDFALESPVILLPLIRDGKLRALAVTSAKRKAEIAEIPTMREGGADFVATLLTGVVAPAGTPAPIVERLNAVINDSLKTPEMQATLEKFGSEAKITTPQDFAAYLAGRDREVGRGRTRGARTTRLICIQKAAMRRARCARPAWADACTETTRLPMSVQALGYIGLRAKELGDWQKFGSDFLGLQRVDKTRTAMAFRMDDRKQRVIIDADGGQGIGYFGWEVGGRRRP